MWRCWRRLPMTMGMRNLRARGVHQRQYESYEALKADFKEWLRKEVKLVSLFLGTGLTAIFIYAYRDDSPVRQMQYILAQATVASDQGDKYRARQLTQRAYAIASSVSDREPHLYELAFAIAAQFEAAEQFDQAKKYYHEAMTHVPYAKHASKNAAMYRMITLDRIAECCHNMKDVKNAEIFYHRALDLYEKERGRGQLKKDQMDAEVCGIWFNYARLCIDGGDLPHSQSLLKIANKCVRENNLPEDKAKMISVLLNQLQSPSLATELTK